MERQIRKQKTENVVEEFLKLLQEAQDGSAWINDEALLKDVLVIKKTESSTFYKAIPQTVYKAYLKNGIYIQIIVTGEGDDKRITLDVRHVCDTIDVNMCQR